MKPAKFIESGFNGSKNACAFLLFLVASAVNLSAQNFATLVTFDGTNGSVPTAALVQGVDGNLYGTTTGGGSTGAGTAFKMTTTGNLTTIYDFCTVGACVDGSDPSAGLTLGADGTFYGVTNTGGMNLLCNESSRCGTIFKMTSGGSLTTIHFFCALYHCGDGENPLGTLVQGANGSFYGTTSFGTDNANSGTLYAMTPAGDFTTFIDFSYFSADGADPQSGLALGTDGSLYGTTIVGGAENCNTGGCGTVFKIGSAGKFTLLYSFCSQGGNPCADGQNPFAALVQGSDGNFYGTTTGAGPNNGGTVFKMTPSGALTTLYAFCSLANCEDGSNPLGAMVQATDGNLYGTTKTGGFPGCSVEGVASGCGTIFRITTSGTLTTLYRFCHQKNCPDGSLPQAALVQATDGNFYGITTSGGMPNCPYPGFECGTTYRLAVGLGPFVSLPRPFGKVGQIGRILGQGLAGTTAVAVNGTPATFTVVSDHFIRATIPPGATTGLITVTTPSGTLISNVPFQLIPE